MDEQQFRGICWCNRLLVLLCCGFSLQVVLNTHHVLLYPVIGVLLLLHFGFFMLNEFVWRLRKRMKSVEHQTLQYLGVVLPLVFQGYVGFTYLLSGSFMVLLLGCFGLLQAQFLGQPVWAKRFGLAHLVLFLLTLPLGYPHPIAWTPLNIALVLLGLGLPLYVLSTFMAQLLHAHAGEMNKLQSMAATDAITGLTNRRQFNVRLLEEIARARRHETPLSLALFDLDDFKKLNDFYGHPVGDRILKELGHLIRNNIRESDLAARYGGEEFALILPETRETEAYELLERLRRLIAQTVFCLPDNPLTLTVSIGLAQLDPKRYTPFEFVELADKALYEAKNQGKNRVARASSLIPQILMTQKKSVNF